MTCGIAIFVKTPGLSPIKTRLAADLGPTRALEIYRASIDCVRASVELACARGGLQAYWAVAEADGASAWDDWPVLLQPDGDLGARMAGIHAQLRDRHRGALLLGADVPGIDSATLLQACVALADAPTRVVAPARDGGFVLFGANADLRAEAWSQIAYGAADTAAQFLRLVGAQLPLIALAEQRDLDTLDDLHALRTVPPASPTSAQRRFWDALNDWCATPTNAR